MGRHQLECIPLTWSPRRRTIHDMQVLAPAVRGDQSQNVQVGRIFL
jgi:hypothetical protein